MKKLVSLIIVAFCIIVGCSKSSNDTTQPGGGMNTPLDCNTVTAKTYATDVSPIIQTKCATDGACHGSGSTNGPGPLINYTAIFNARADIRTAVANGTMPKTGTLTTAQKNSILCWVDGGGKND